MSLIPIEVAMQHVYADEADQDQVERKLASAISTAEQYMGRRVYANREALISDQVAATAELPSVVKPIANFNDMPSGQVEMQLKAEMDNARLYELKMQIRGIVINPAIEIGILLILGDLYANRENSTDKPANEMPMSAKFHLQPFRIMGV